MPAEAQGIHYAAQSGALGSWVKRAVDIVVSSLFLLAFAPVILVIAVLLRVAESGPVFFQWNIVGAGGRPIRSYKFRTMVVAAESAEAELRRQGHNEMKSVYFKARNDPRVTRIGRFLRRYSLDEIPSLWSVLKGDMSLVGPRPLRLTEVPYLRDWHYERFAVRPGLTSPWIIFGKEKISDFDEITTLDIEYIRRWSIWRDFAILAGTAGYVLSGRNY